MGLPCSRVRTSARSPRLSAMSAAARFRMFPRDALGSLRQEPNARWAPSMAALNSSGPARAACAISAPVAGLHTAILSGVSSRHLPPIQRPGRVPSFERRGWIESGMGVEGQAVDLHRVGLGDGAGVWVHEAAVGDGLAGELRQSRVGDSRRPERLEEAYL